MRLSILYVTRARRLRRSPIRSRRVAFYFLMRSQDDVVGVLAHRISFRRGHQREDSGGAPEGEGEGEGDVADERGQQQDTPHWGMSAPLSKTVHFPSAQ